MKILAIIVLSLIVIITAFLGLGFTLCAVSGDSANQASYVLADIIDIAIMVGSVMLIFKLNKKKNSL